MNPLHLTREEEAAAVAAMRAGDEAARGRLAHSVLGWARILANRCADRHFIDPDDAFGAAQLGVLQALKSFDPARGRLITHATSWIIQAIQRHAPYARGAVRVPYYLGHGGPKHYRRRARAALRTEGLADMPTPEPRRAPEWAEEAVAAVRRLPEWHREVVERTVGLGRDPEPLSALAEECGVTREAIRQVREVAMRTIRKDLKRLGCDIKGNR